MSKKILFFLLSVMALSSCSTFEKVGIYSAKGVTPPTDESSSAIYGYIDFGENKGMFSGNVWSKSGGLEVYFYPYDHEKDKNINWDLNFVEREIYKAKCVRGWWWGQDKTFFVTRSVEPGVYGMLMIKRENSSEEEQIWMNPSQTLVKVREGQLNYWGAIAMERDKNIFSNKYFSKPVSMEKEMVLGIMSEKLLDQGWGDRF